MDFTIFDFVSKGVAESWFRDEYLLGPGSRAAYRDIGFMLLLRGAYWYAACDASGTLLYGGCCYADVENDELTFTGVRLYTNDVLDRATLLPWRSQMSKIIGSGGSSSEARRLVFLYALRDPNKFAPAASAAYGTFQGRVPKAVGHADRKDWQAFFQSIKPNAPAPVNTLPENVRDEDVKAMLIALSEWASLLDDESKDSILLSQTSTLTLSAATIPLTLDGAYGPLSSHKGVPQTGTVTFQRIT